MKRALLALFFLAEAVLSAPPAERAAEAWFLPYMSVADALQSLRDPDIVQQLAVTDAQRKAFDELDAARGERYRELPRIPYNRKTRTLEKENPEVTAKRRSMRNAIEDDFRPKLLEMLSDQQRTRFRQVLRQIAVATTLIRDPEVAERIALTEKQIADLKAIQDQYGTEIREIRKADLLPPEMPPRWDAAETKMNDSALALLDTEQKRAWSQLVGDPVDVARLMPKLSPIRPPMMRQHPAGSGPFSRRQKTPALKRKP